MRWRAIAKRNSAFRHPSWERAPRVEWFRGERRRGGVHPIVPIEVDTSRAPAFIRYRFFGDFPSLEEQSTLREHLIRTRLLTSDTVAIMDTREITEVPDDDVLAKLVAAALQRGGWPRRRAYLINPATHLHMIKQFQDLAMTTVTTAAFVDEAEAMAWLMPR
jgi:hypothetical protein